MTTKKTYVNAVLICDPCGAQVKEQDAGQEGWIIVAGRPVCWYCQQSENTPLPICLSINTYLNISENSDTKSYE